MKILHFTNKKFWNYPFFLIFLLLILIYFLYKYNLYLSDVAQYTNHSRELYQLIDWVKINTRESDVILTQWTLAPFIYGMADRAVIATTKVYPSEVDIVAERYSDIARFFFSTNENDALRIVKKYNITYVIIPNKFDFFSCNYIRACHLIDDNQTLVLRLLSNNNITHFKIVYDTENVKVYRILPYSIDNGWYDAHLKSEFTNYSKVNVVKSKSKNVIGSIIPHDVFHTKRIIIDNLQHIGDGYKNIIILGPDHTSISSYPITASDLGWQGYNGIMRPELIKIKRLGIPLDNSAHEFEWSIRSVIPFVHYWQRNATVVPILFRHDITYDEAFKFGEKLAENLDDKTLLMASIDFSHVVPANPKINSIEDHKSLKALSEFNKEEVYSLITEGKPALVAFLTAMEINEAKNVRLLNISSQSYPKGSSTQSTGYISLHYSR